MSDGYCNNVMPQIIRPLALAVFSGLVALTLSACGPSSSASQSQAPAEIHGEPISPAKNSTILATAAPVITISAKAAEPTSPPPADPDYAAIGFDKLAAYHFEVDDAPFTNQNAAADTANTQIPATIKSLSGEKISIKGFMLPLKVADGVTTEFLIMKDQSMCCFGTVPKINEWISVKTTGAGVKPIMDQPVSMLGTLHVGALRENGYLVGIYQMDGDKLAATDN
jgi:hypothetical protein